MTWAQVSALVDAERPRKSVEEGSASDLVALAGMRLRG